MFARTLAAPHFRLFCAIVADEDLETDQIDATKQQAEAAEKALEHDPACFDAVMVLSHLEMEAGNLDKAQQLLANNIHLFRSAYMYCSLGSVQYKAGRFADALTSFTTALGLQPDNAAASKGRAQAAVALEGSTGDAGGDGGTNEADISYN